MAQIDVSELLYDPDFVDAITVLRRTASVNTFGEAVISETTFQTVGSVQPAPSNKITRLPEAVQMEDVRSFYLNLPIVQDVSSGYPDIIVFQGARYQVQTSSNWLNFGAGWNEGLCVKEKPSQ